MSSVQKVSHCRLAVRTERSVLVYGVIMAESKKRKKRTRYIRRIAEYKLFNDSTDNRIIAV